ncbi:MAG: hypothetical protein BA865_00935 [Desulfobacterales bacterium S5133MH4]|nr:MAG: hypothetical protein BA865_00935 [Desulfobacterales bacterium S5133MH4]
MKNNFAMHAQRVNGTIHVDVSGPLDISRAVDVLHFLNVYARAKQPIVVNHCNLSMVHKSGMDILEKGLQTLSDLGHPVCHVG